MLHFGLPRGGAGETPAPTKDLVARGLGSVSLVGAGVPPAPLRRTRRRWCSGCRARQASSAFRSLITQMRSCSSRPSAAVTKGGSAIITSNTSIRKRPDMLAGDIRRVSMEALAWINRRTEVFGTPHTRWHLMAVRHRRRTLMPSRPLVCGTLRVLWVETENTTSWYHGTWSSMGPQGTRSSCKVVRSFGHGGSCPVSERRDER